MHIAFLTLFLGLTSGVQPFELTVSGPVASVDILVDGVLMQRLQDPPWKGMIDFGFDLAPHESRGPRARLPGIEVLER